MSGNKIGPSPPPITPPPADAGGDNIANPAADGAAIPDKLGPLIGGHRIAQARADQVLPEATPLDKRQSAKLDSDSIEKSSFWSKAKNALGKIANFVSRGISSALQAVKPGASSPATPVESSSVSGAGDPVVKGFDVNTLLGAREINFSADNIASMSELIRPETQTILENGAHSAFDKDLNRATFTFGGVHQPKPEGAEDTAGKQAIFDNLMTLAGGDAALATKLSGLANQGLAPDAIGLISEEFDGILQMDNATIHYHVEKNPSGSFTVRLDQTAIVDKFAEGFTNMRDIDPPLNYTMRIEVTLSADGSQIDAAPLQVSLSEKADIEFCERRFGMELSTDQQRLWDMCDTEEVDLVKFFKACSTGTIDDDTSHQIRAGRNISDQVNALI